MATKHRTVRIEHDNDKFVQERKEKRCINYSQSLNSIIVEARTNGEGQPSEPEKEER
jgi:hypothetical protein